VVLTDVLLLQPRQSIHVRSALLHAPDVCIALVVDIGTTEELHGRSNDACYEEDEEDKTKEEHDAREKPSLRNEDEHDEDEDYSNDTDGYAVGKNPIYMPLAIV
jgi:hypothetical protein